MINFSRSFLLLCLGILILSIQEDTRSGYNVATAAQSVCTGDLDQDGFNDIVVGNNYNSSTNWGGISILRNQGWGNFTFTDSVYAYANEWAVAITQLDSIPMEEILFNKFDPTLDLVYIGIIFNNNLGDIFYLNTLNNGSIDYLVAGDIDGNGSNDIIFACNQGLYWGIFYNYGNRSFSAPEIHHVTTYYPSGLAVGDLNNDGRDDIVLCGQLIDVYFSYSSGFQNLPLSAGGYAGDVAITDFDQDGYKDILGNSGFGSTVLVMYKNNGNATFEKMPDFIFQPACGQFFVADFNNDALPDVVYQKGNAGYILWYNQGNFQLADSIFIAVPGYGEAMRCFTCADLDNNAFNDIITVRLYFIPIPANVDIRFNNGQGHFIPDPIVGLKDYTDIISFGLKNYPNPFQDETIFRFNIKETSIAEVSVFDLQGTFVTCLINQKLAGGSHKIKWRGLNNGGQPCKPGAFIAYLKVNGKISQTIKVVKI
jgi:hypothetical protein